MYTLELWKNVSKKVNSTYRVNTQPDKTVQVDLKEDTSLDSPTFLLDLDEWSFNYARLQGRYYFIQDVRRNITHQLEIECRTDYLATYRDEIGNYTAFVERSAHTYNPLLPDESISTESKIAWASHETIDLMYSLSNPTGFLNTTGCFLLRTVGQTNSDVSSTGITTYILDRDDLEIVFDFMFSTGSYADMFGDMVTKSFFNPFQYIVDLRWVPLTKQYFYNAGAVVSAPLKFGWWTVGYGQSIYNGYVLTSQVMHKNFSLSCPISKYGDGDFRRYDSRYTNYKCYLFGVGTVDISPVDVIYNQPDNFMGVKISLTIDFTTGEMITLLRRSDGTHPIGEYKTQFAIPVQISQVNSNLFKSAENTFDTASNSIQSVAMASITGNPVSFALAGISATMNVTGAIINGIHGEIAAGTSGNGTNGNRASLLEMPYYILYLTQYNSCDVPNVVNGRPLAKNVKINTLGGYTKCAGASVTIAGFSGDKEAVNAALNGGFYYE